MTKTTAPATQTSTLEPQSDKLPDIVLSDKKTDAITGLLMLGDNLNQVDDKIDNELIMPVNKPRQPDLTNDGNLDVKLRKKKPKEKCKPKDYRALLH